MSNETNRDRHWLEALFDTHHQRLLAFAVRRVGHDSAEDVVAEVFATAWRRRDEVPDAPVAWLFQVARNHVLHEYRSKGRRSRLQEVLNLRRPDQTEGHARVEVDSVLNHLSPDDAEILRLTIWEELTPSEIAEVMGISPGAARNRLMRARDRAQRIHELASVGDEPIDQLPQPQTRGARS